MKFVGTAECQFMEIIRTEKFHVWEIVGRAESQFGELMGQQIPILGNYWVVIKPTYGKILGHLFPSSLGSTCDFFDLKMGSTFTILGIPNQNTANSQENPYLIPQLGIRNFSCE